MPNPVVHFEIGGRDTARAAAFFEAAFGWGSTPSSPYNRTLEIGGGFSGHLTALGHEPHSYVTVYIEVDDVAAHLVRIEAAGGQKVIGPLPLPDGRKFAWFKDVDGNMLGLFSAAAPA
jgi:uncharacterized protein